MEPVLRSLSQPEYLHTLINPVPIYGTTIALIALIIGLALRSRPAVVTGLAVVLISALSVWPVTYLGDEAYDRVLSMADADGQAWLAAHQDRADKLVWSFYLLAAVAAAAIVVPRKWPRSAKSLAIATVVLAVVALGAGGYIAYAGGRIRHREFRNERPPPKPAGSSDDACRISPRVWAKAKPDLPHAT